MSNFKFIKISQEDPTPATDVPSAPQTASEAAKAKEKAKREKAQRKQTEKSEALSRFQAKKGTGIEGLLSNIVSDARRQGENADALALELESRSRLIRKLLGYLSEDEVAEYFDQFLFKKEIPWAIAFPLMELALKGASNGIKVPDAMDFVLAHYDQKRNFPLTEDIMNSAISLQPGMRSINIMKFLKDALEEKISPGMNFLVVGPKRIADFVILNELMQLSLTRPEEDLEKTRVQFKKSLDSFNRAREVDDRYKAIFQMLLSDEFNRVMARNVEFVTQMFQGIATKPEFLALRRVLVSLKMGEALRDQVFSDLEQKRTAPQSPNATRGQTVAKFNDNSNKRLAQEKQDNEESKIIPVDKQNLIKAKIVDPLLLILDEFINVMSNPNGITDKKGKPIPFKDQNERQKVLSDVTAFRARIDDIKTAINTKRLTTEIFNNNYWRALEQYLKSYRSVGVFVQGSSSEKKSKNNDKFIKIAQPTGDPLSSFSKLFDGSIVNDIIVAGGLITTASGVMTLDPGKALGSLALTLLFNDEASKIRDLNNLGLNAPRDYSSPEQRLTAQKNIEQLFVNSSDYQEFTKLQQTVNDIESSISDFEDVALSVTESQLKTGVGQGDDVSAYVNNPDAVKKAYLDLREQCAEGMRIVEYLRNMVKNRLETVSRDPNFVNSRLAYQTIVRAWSAEMDKLTASFRNKYFRYSSIGLIAKEMQQAKIFRVELEKLIPELENYLGSGSNIADLIRIPGGIGEKLKNIVDKEKEMKDIIFKSISDMEEYIKRKQLVTQAPVQGNVSQPATTTTPSETKVAPSNVSPTVSDQSNLGQVAKDMFKGWAAKQLGPQFSNLVNFASDENEFIKTASSPQELSDLYTSNFKFSQTSVPPANSPKLTHYRGQMQKLMSNPQQLGWLERHITKDTSLSASERSTLLSEINQLKATSNVLGLSNIIGQVVPPSVQQMMGATPSAPVSGVGATVTPSTVAPGLPAAGLGSTVPSTTPSSTPSPTVQPSTTTGAGTGATVNPNDPEEVNRQFLNSVAANLNRATGLNISFDPEAVEKQPELFLNSLTQQYKAVNDRYQKLRGIQYKLLTGPGTDISFLRGASVNKPRFIKVNVVENDKEADQENIDYVADYYNELYEDSDDEGYDYLQEDIEYGDVLKNPQKYRNKPTPKKRDN